MPTITVTAAILQRVEKTYFPPLTPRWSWFAVASTVFELFSLMFFGFFHSFRIRYRPAWTLCTIVEHRFFVCQTKYYIVSFLCIRSINIDLLGFFRWSCFISDTHSRLALESHSRCLYLMTLSLFLESYKYGNSAIFNNSLFAFRFSLHLWYLFPFTVPKLPSCGWSLNSMPPDADAYLNRESIKMRVGKSMYITRNTHESHFYTYISLASQRDCIVYVPNHMQIDRVRFSKIIQNFFGYKRLVRKEIMGNVRRPGACDEELPYCFACKHFHFCFACRYTNPRDQLREHNQQDTFVSFEDFWSNPLKVFSSCTHKEKHKGH